MQVHTVVCMQAKHLRQMIEIHGHCPGRELTLAREGGGGLRVIGTKQRRKYFAGCLLNPKEAGQRHSWP